MARVGAKGLTIRAVAVEAGYVPGAVYFYFHSKAAIISELAVQRTLGPDQAAARRPRRATPPTAPRQPPKPSRRRTRSSRSTPKTASSPGSERALMGRLISLFQTVSEPLDARAPAARTSPSPRARPLVGRDRPCDARPHGPPRQARRHRGGDAARSRALPEGEPGARRKHGHVGRSWYVIPCAVQHEVLLRRHGTQLFLDHTGAAQRINARLRKAPIAREPRYCARRSPAAGLAPPGVV